MSCVKTEKQPARLPITTVGDLSLLEKEIIPFLASPQTIYSPITLPLLRFLLLPSRPSICNAAAIHRHAGHLAAGLEGAVLHAEAHPGSNRAEQPAGALLTSPSNPFEGPREGPPPRGTTGDYAVFLRGVPSNRRGGML